MKESIRKMHELKEEEKCKKERGTKHERIKSINKK